MTPERWERIQGLYHAARAHAESDRAQFLANACAEDAALERELQALLNQPVSTGGFIDFLGGSPLAQLTGVASNDFIGRQLGSYRVLSLLGRGGMGEVYRARDSRLGRDVAIKVLPTRFTEDAERLARFESEARMLAALNHPHIGAIYGLEDADGRRRSCWSSSRARHSPIGCAAGQSRRPTRRGSRDRSRTRSMPRIGRASSIAT
jgi:hypothetical protein